MAHPLIRQPIPLRPFSSSSPLTDLSSIKTPSVSPRMPPIRLLSPINLSSRRGSLVSPTSPSPTGPSKRRRSRGEDTPRAHGKQRRCRLKDDCIIRRNGLTLFDDLPWISIMDVPPTLHNESYSMVDLADLSQIPDEDCRASAKPKHASSTGPIRRRRTSLRSTPFPTDAAVTKTSSSASSSKSTSSTPASATYRHRLDLAMTNDTVFPLPELSPSFYIDSTESDSDSDDLFCPSTPPPPSVPLSLPMSNSSEFRLPFEDEYDVSPKTPPRRASVLPSTVHFHNLMPVLFPTPAEDDNSEDLWWLKMPSHQHRF